MNEPFPVACISEMLHIDYFFFRLHKTPVFAKQTFPLVVIVALEEGTLCLQDLFLEFV